MFRAVLGSALAVVVASKRFCPQSQDFETSGNVVWNDNGWTLYGSGSVGSLASWNLIGGSVEFEYDATNANDGVNTNFYTISPENGVAASGYCDIPANGSPQCMEMDMIEANGNCAMATTIHTWPNDDGDCDIGGCQSIATISNPMFKIVASFSEDGLMTVTKDGVANDNYSPFPSDTSDEYVVDTMKRIGAALWGSQWEGWVPDDDCPGYWGGLDSSYYSISNLVVTGEFVQGTYPTECDDDEYDNDNDNYNDNDNDVVPSSCVVEDNYDYSGYDISYDDVSGSDVCCDGCAATAGCIAWTFSADQWGDVRCYYKSSMAGRTYTSGLVSGYLTQAGTDDTTDDSGDCTSACSSDVCSWQSCDASVNYVCSSGDAMKGCSADSSLWSSTAVCDSCCDTNTCPQEVALTNSTLPSHLRGSIKHNKNLKPIPNW